MKLRKGLDKYFAKTYKQLVTSRQLKDKQINKINIRRNFVKS